MKATKHYVTITMHVLSMDAVPSLVKKALKEIELEFEDGDVSADDGDHVQWSVTREEVEF